MFNCKSLLSSREFLCFVELTDEFLNTSFLHVYLLVFFPFLYETTKYFLQWFLITASSVFLSSSLLTLVIPLLLRLS